MADPALGTKQICPNCTAKFYDLNKRPAHCPKCAFEFDPEEALRTRRTRVRPVAPDEYEMDDEAEDQVKGKTPGEEDEDEEPEIVTPEIDEVVADDTLLADEDDELDPADPARVAPDPVDMDIEDADLADDDADDVPFLEDDEDDTFDEDIDGLPGEGNEDDI
ncbi:TIGR02300 family protein [Asticcacaulis sp.]|uniref:TIGR02300 family protein n=1 Tax=Asticcacaulis sp. TaxID=1872648 RepID=UPI0026053374|nr:TIGR02300 family protein [Asticcacaulis sp.]